MPSEPVITEFVSLVKDTQEQLAYFHELGVINLETNLQASNLTDTQKQFQPPLSTPPLGQYEQDFRSGVAASIPSIAPGIGLSASDSMRRDPSLRPDTLFGDLAATSTSSIIEKSSETVEQIWADIGDCTRCPLHQGRTHIVQTEGNRRARLMFVGEAPGADEDAQARPFVGRAGQLLTKIIEAIGFKREDVLIGNVNRCRPPANRPPTSEEATMCKPFLLREIAVVQPEVIVVLGNTAMRNLLDIKQGITRVRGHFQDYHGVKVMPTFHPAYLLRDPSKKQETWQDLKKVRDYLETTPRREN